MVEYIKLTSISCKHDKLILDESRGEQVCINCAQVIEENMVDYGYEFLFEDFLNSRTGPKSSLSFSDGLSTMIAKSNTDVTGKPLSYTMKHTMNKARIWDSRSKTSTSGQRNLRLDLLELDKLKEKMGLSDPIIERAAYFYRKAMENDLLQGRTVKGIAGACLYAACRDMGTNRTIIDISKNIQEKRRIIAKNYRILFRMLTLNVSVTDPAEIIVRIANNLEISEHTKREAFLMLDGLRDHNLIVGKKPESVAATVLHMACIKTDEDVSQNKIADISQVSSVTIRHRFKEFTKYVPIN